MTFTRRTRFQHALIGLLGLFATTAFAVECTTWLKNVAEVESSKVVTGYFSEVASLSPTEAHTIENIPKYLADSLGAESIRAIAQRREFYIFEGDGPEALKEIAARGWSVGHEVQKPVGYHRVFEIRKGKKKAYAVTRVNGDDRILHIQSFFRLAGASSEKIHTVRNYRNWHAEYLSAFKREGYAPDLAIYGLTPHVEGTFIDTNHLIERPYNYLKKSEGGVDESDIASRPFKVLTLEDGRKVWLFYPLYGDLAREVVQALYDAGTRKILFLGTAGGIDPALKVGDWVSPKVDGILHSKRSRPTTYTRVSTPNIETNRWLQEQNRLGNGMTEVEAGYVIELARKYPDLKMSIDMILSDVVQGANKLDLHQIPKVSQIPNLHSGLTSIIDEHLGKFRLSRIDDVYFPNTADRELLAQLDSPASAPLVRVAKRLGMQRLGTGVYQKTDVFSGQFAHLFFSADVRTVPAKWIGYKARLIGNPMNYHVTPEQYVRHVRVKTENSDPESLQRLCDLAYENGSGEVLFSGAGAGYEVSIGFAFIDDYTRFSALVPNGKLFRNGELSRLASVSQDLSSPDLEKRVRSAREMILSKTKYRQNLKLNERKLRQKIPEGHPLRPVAEKIMARMNNPNALATFIEGLMRKAAKVSEGVPSPEEYKGAIASILKAANALPITTAPRKFLSPEEFNAVLARGKPFLDESFSSRTHGSWTHAFQTAYLSDLLTQEFGPNGVEIFFKQMSQLPDTALWEFLFNSLNDIPNHYSNPEILNQVLWRVFGLN